MEPYINPRTLSIVGKSDRPTQQHLAPQSIAFLSEPSQRSFPTNFRMPNPASTLQTLQQIYPLLNQNIQQMNGPQIVEQEAQKFRALHGQVTANNMVLGQLPPIQQSVISQPKKETQIGKGTDDKTKKIDLTGRPLCSDSEASQSNVCPTSNAANPNSSNNKASLPNEDIAEKFGEPLVLWKHSSRKVSLSSVSFGDTIQKLNKNSPDVLLPSSYKPTEYCIICGRGKEFFNHTGNRRFRVTINILRERYSRATTKAEKGEIVTEVMDMIHGAGGRFVRCSAGRWWEVNEALSREKIGALFRDVLYEAYKSSTKAKVERRRQLKRIKNKKKSSQSHPLNTSERMLIPGQSEKGSNQVPPPPLINVDFGCNTVNPQEIRRPLESSDPAARLMHHLPSVSNISTKMPSTTAQNERASISFSGGPFDFVEKTPEDIAAVDVVHCWLIGWSRPFLG